MPFWRKALAPFLLLLIVIGFFWKLTLTNQYSWLQSPDLAYQVVPWIPVSGKPVSSRCIPHLGSLSVRGPVADRTGSARSRLPIQLDSLPAATARWPHQYPLPELVLRFHPLLRGAVLLSARSRPGTQPIGIRDRRRFVRARRLRRQRRLAADDQRRDLDPTGLSVPDARISG